MASHKLVPGAEITYWAGDLLFWTQEGVYTVIAETIKRHEKIKDSRLVIIHLYDTQACRYATYVEMYPAIFDDHEIIYRWLFGAGACDCVRGQLIYGPNSLFNCNNGPNRFIIRKLAIKGEDSKCVIDYKGFV